MSQTRRKAIEALTAVGKGAIAQAALENTGLEGRERNHCSDLVYGALRCRIILRKLLGMVLPRPGKLPPAMYLALEIAAYSLLYQDSIPDYAAVNETVEIIKSRFGPRLAKVANGALRALQKMSFEKPDSNSVFSDWADYYSMPEDIANLWLNAYGRENAINLMKRSFNRPYAGLRINKSNAQGDILASELASKPQAIKISNYCVAFPPGAVPEMVLDRPLPYWQEKGVLSWQAAGSQLALENIGIYEHWRDSPVWDACAGVGGKMLALLENGIKVSLASDTSKSRLGKIILECSRLGLPAPALMLANSAMPPIDSWNGNILVDAPCSGLGVLARRPDIKDRFDKNHLESIGRIQGNMLLALSDCLGPEREFAYITCSLNPDENEKQIEKLLIARPEMEIRAQWQTGHEHPWLEGMYACRLRKR